MTRMRRFGATVGALCGLAVGLLLSLFLGSIVHLGRDGLLTLIFLSGLSAVIGAGLGLERADLLIQSIRRLSRAGGKGPSRGPALWPSELNRVATQMSEVERERDEALAGQRFVQERLEAIIAGLRDGVIVVGPDLSIVSINQAATGMFRTSVKAAIGQPLVEITRDSDLVRITREGVERRAAQTTPIDYRRAGRQFNVRVQPIDQAGRRLAILVVQDITELRQLENVRRDFVSNVSHELRTPLAAIRALVETLADGAIDDKSVAEDFLRRVVSEVDRLNELIEDLLDLGRLESGRLPLRRSAISVEELVRRSVERISPQAEEADVGIRIETTPEEIMLNVDVLRMEQVLTNLLDNAIKFSPRGEDVAVRWQQVDSGVELSVIDHGVGILPDDLPRIFERFYKSDRARQSAGTGLGLAIAKHIMAAHGGDLTVASVYEQGATFAVRLPLTGATADLSEDPARPESRPQEY